MNAVQKLSSSNPYSHSATGQDYHVSGWQQFLKTLGFRTGYDAWKENMGVQAAEYQAGLEQKAYDEEYNLPINQVARMRAAGLNPDINGGDSIDAGSAQPMGEDPSTPMQSSGDEAQLQNFANGVLSVFTTGLGIVQSMQGVTRNRIQNLILGTQSEQIFSDWSKGKSLDFLPDKPDALVSEDGSAISWQQQALNRAMIFAKKSLPKKMQQKFLDQVSSYWNGAPGTTEAYNKWREEQEARFKYGLNRGTYGDLTEDDVLYGMTKPLADLALRALKGNMKAEAEHAENEATFEEQVDPALAATAQNSQNQATSATNNMNAMLRGTMVEILSFLKSASKGHGVGAGLASVALALLSSQSLGLVPTAGQFLGSLK